MIFGKAGKAQRVNMSPLALRSCPTVDDPLAYKPPKATCHRTWAKWRLRRTADDAMARGSTPPPRQTAHSPEQSGTGSTGALGLISGFVSLP